MAKHSDLFQRVVRVLYETLKPVGGLVTESATVIEPTSGASREVDILAESTVFGVSPRPTPSQ